MCPGLCSWKCMSFPSQQELRQHVTPNRGHCPQTGISEMGRGSAEAGAGGDCRPEVPESKLRATVGGPTAARLRCQNRVTVCDCPSPGLGRLRRPSSPQRKGAKAQNLWETNRMMVRNGGTGFDFGRKSCRVKDDVWCMAGRLLDRKGGWGQGHRPHGKG